MTVGSSPSESFVTRLGLVLGAEWTFAMLVRLVTGTPPSFFVTVTFGIVLSILIAVQACRRGQATAE